MNERESSPTPRRARRGLIAAGLAVGALALSAPLVGATVGPGDNGASAPSAGGADPYVQSQERGEDRRDGDCPWKRGGGADQQEAPTPRPEREL